MSFSGLECDILRDGSMDVAEDALAELDLVIGSVHSSFGLESTEMTDRFLRALESPSLRILGHITGRLLLSRDAYPFDFEMIATAAAQKQVWFEINASPRNGLIYQRIWFASPSAKAAGLSSRQTLTGRVI